MMGECSREQMTIENKKALQTICRAFTSDVAGEGPEPSTSGL